MDPKERLGMKGHNELKNHPFFEGIDWVMLKMQKVPVPAYEIVRDQQDPSVIRSFSFYDQP